MGRTSTAGAANGSSKDSDAEEVSQDILAKLARKLRDFYYDPSCSFRGWLKTSHTTPGGISRGAAALSFQVAVGDQFEAGVVEDVTEPVAQPELVGIAWAQGEQPGECAATSHKSPAFRGRRNRRPARAWNQKRVVMGDLLDPWHGAHPGPGRRTSGHRVTSGRRTPPRRIPSYEKAGSRLPRFIRFFFRR
jgi:hypothetical protein